MAEIQPPEDAARAQALEKMGRKVYDRHVTRSAPPWDEAPDMIRYQVMEQVNDMVNDVLEHFTPASPDHAALALRFELLAQEIEGLEVGTPGVLLIPSQVATAIRRTIKEGSEYGSARKGGTDG